MDFREPSLPRARRAQDLLNRLTEQERIAMLHQRMPAIERLGLAPYHTGGEVLHGVAWLGTATTFPQPVGLAAAWDPELLEQIGDVVSTEMRAKRAQDPEVGLNVWAPVVNTLRHPGWGRNEEGYSEDPHLTAHFATAFCRGLKGRDERVWKTAPTLKHFLAYNNETDRSSTSSNLTPQVAQEEELPAFREPIDADVVAAVMPSYNQVNGIPAHLHGELLSELRAWTAEPIAVVSDAMAPTLVTTVQRAAADQVAGNAAVLLAGVDSFTDDSDDPAPTIARIQEALDRGLITMADVDRAVLRLLELRLRTGEFDPQDPYKAITAEHIDLPEHRALARRATAQGVVVLRNDAGLLPLTGVRSVAVVGPLADTVLLDWYSGTAPYSVTLAQGLREALALDHGTAGRVTVDSGSDVVALRAANGRYLSVTPGGDAVLATAETADLTTNLAVTDWGAGALTFRSATSGRLLTGVGGNLRADAEKVGGWEVQETFERRVHPDGTWSLLHRGSGRWVRVQRDTGLVCAEARTLAEAARFQPRLLESGTARVARLAAECDAAVVAVGNDPHVNGRETTDRPNLDLPEAMVEIWRAAIEANPRTVLTIISSYPYVLGPGIAEAPTVVWSSHAGQELGHGLADVLTGAVEPAGRLAQTWPARAEQAGDLFDYNTRSQRITYRHLPPDEAGLPRFAFGHGLTYSQVAYQALDLAPETVAAPAPTRHHPALAPSNAAGPGVVTALVRVTNAGHRPIDELVQVYSLGALGTASPQRLLLGYRRLRLAAGETGEVSVAFDVARLATWVPEAGAGNRSPLLAGDLRVAPGTYTIAAGPSSVELPLRATLHVLAPGEPQPSADG